MTSPEVLRYGIIGCGQVVRELHLPAWRAVSGIQLVGICDSFSSALTDMQKACPGVRAFTDLDSFLTELKDLAFVDVATPGPTHVAVIDRVLSRGINILCEKPLALTRSEASRLYFDAERAGIMLTAIHNYRFKKNSQAALAAYRRGILGDVESAVVRFRMGSLFTEQTGWRRRERESRTVLFDFGTHLVDLALLFLGPLDSLRFVDADVDDLGIQRVVFGTAHCNGSRGLFDFIIDAASTSTEIEIQGESRALNLQFFPPGLRFLPARDTPVHRVRGEIGRAVEYIKAAIGERIWGGAGQRAASHSFLFEQFAEALRYGRPNPIRPDDVLRVTALLEDVARHVYKENLSQSEAHTRC